jgi:hypothetical protein
MACKRRKGIVLEEAHTFWVAVLLSSPPLSRHLVRKALYKYQLRREKKFKEGVLWIGPNKDDRKESVDLFQYISFTGLSHVLSCRL